MNKNQYSYYKKAVQGFLDENEVRPGLFSPVEEQSEPFFSWSPCECCKSPLGGNRETYRFVGKEDFQADICEDCVYYLHYDRLDDMTMADMD